MTNQGDGHRLVISRDEQRKRGWFLSWRCSARQCDTRGNSTTPGRDTALRLFGILRDAHQDGGDTRA